MATTTTAPRVYVDGVFDLFHYGHAEMLQRVREAFPDAFLIVGVCSDEDCRKFKRQPVLTMAERVRSVSGCKWVDDVICDAPWVIDAQFLEKHKIDIVCHEGSPYAAPGTADVYSYVKSIGKFQSIDRTDGISTSSLIHRVLLREGKI